MCQTDTYEPRPNYSAPEIIAYDFGYKEGQVGNAFWTEYSADKLLNLVHIFLLKSDACIKVSDAYILGFHHGSRIHNDSAGHLSTVPEVQSSGDNSI